MPTCVLYLDMEGKPVPNAWLPNNKNRLERSDSEGVVRYLFDIPPDMVFYPLGYGTVKIIPCDKKEPKEAPPGMYLDCSARSGGAPYPQAGVNYCYVPGDPDVYPGVWRETPKYNSFGEVSDAVVKNTQDISTVQGQILSLNDMITGVLRSISSIENTITQTVLNMKDIILGWVETAFIGIIEKVLEQEVKR